MEWWEWDLPIDRFQCDCDNWLIFYFCLFYFILFCPDCCVAEQRVDGHFVGCRLRTTTLEGAAVRLLGCRMLWVGVVAAIVASAHATTDQGTHLNAEAPIVTDFWDQSSRSWRAHAGAQEEGRQNFRAALFKLQNPSNCSSATFCTCHYPESGLFAMLHTRADCLLLAFHVNCTLIDDGKGNDRMVSGHQYINQDECNFDDVKSPWECYFAPISSCEVHTYDNVRRFHARSTCWDFNKHIQGIDSRFALRSSLLVKSELMAYVMRPVRRLEENVRKWAQKLRIPTTNALDGCLAVHVRHSDKKAVPWTEKQHTAFIGAADDLRSSLGLNVINYMTDDPRVDQIFKIFPFKDPYVRAITVPASAKRVVTDPEEDIGLQLFTHAMLLAQCPVLLGSQVTVH